jgi:hypothetical protein
MANRLLAAISRALSDTSAQTEVHFHQGATRQPAVCFDESCGLPRMDVRS